MMPRGCFDNARLARGAVKVENKQAGPVGLDPQKSFGGRLMPCSDEIWPITAVADLFHGHANHFKQLVEAIQRPPDERYM